MTRYKLIRKYLSFSLLGFFIIIVLLRLLIHEFEFRTGQLNRIFGIAFNLLSILMFVLLFFEINKIVNKILKIILLNLNSIFLFIAIVNLPMYISQIDPEIQYYDEKVLLINPKNHSERLIRQYYINWKSNEKIYSNNLVNEFSCFRYIKKEWTSSDTINWTKP
jgi:hypothetical protein